MPYALRTRKPPRNDPLLTACHDALPPDILEYILLLRVAMPPRYPLRSRRRARARPIPVTLGAQQAVGAYHRKRRQIDMDVATAQLQDMRRLGKAIR